MNYPNYVYPAGQEPSATPASSTGEAVTGNIMVSPPLLIAALVLFLLME